MPPRKTTKQKPTSRKKPVPGAKLRRTRTGKPTSDNNRSPLIAEGSPDAFRVRVRMYRQGLGDCFLLTFPRPEQQPFHILIDCGALGRGKPFMTRIVEHIRDTIRAGKLTGKARLDVVVVTHEHKDHVSGFNQARSVFNDDFDIGAVWMGWTENLAKPEIKAIKARKKKAIAQLHAALASPFAGSAPLEGVAPLLGFSEDDDSTGSGKISEAMEYLKLRGKNANDMRYLRPGDGPFELGGVPSVRAYVLGPPEDPILLRTSAVTEEMKRQDVVYHLTAGGDAGIDALGAALAPLAGASGKDGERYFPFSDEHRIPRNAPGASAKVNPYFSSILSFVSATYDNSEQSWRRIDDDWLAGFGQLALDLDNDTNNTSLVLAFEFVKQGEVLLFVGDAQVGNWQSWAKVEFRLPERARPLPALELLSRTVFYKVGHHCSHNATLKKGGLELMTRDDLVAFIPLDQETAKKQGTKGWEMPAPRLFAALKQRAAERVVMSDVKENICDAARNSGVCATDTYIDFFLP